MEVEDALVEEHAEGWGRHDGEGDERDEDALMFLEAQFGAGDGASAASEDDQDVDDGEDEEYEEDYSDARFGALGDDPDSGPTLADFLLTRGAVTGSPPPPPSPAFHFRSAHNKRAI